MQILSNIQRWDFVISFAASLSAIAVLAFQATDEEQISGGAKKQV